MYLIYGTSVLVALQVIFYIDNSCDVYVVNQFSFVLFVSVAEICAAVHCVICVTVLCAKYNAF